jgi:hypothetical protein
MLVAAAAAPRQAREAFSCCNPKDSGNLGEY